MSMNDKRARSAKFSNEEKLHCLNIIKRYKHIIECKETGVTSWKQKESIWKVIEEEFNAQSMTIFRSADVLKRFYNNKKKETRKIAARIRCSQNETGGGPMDTMLVDLVYDLTLDIINKKTVFGLQNKFDNDIEATAEIENFNFECPNYNDMVEEAGTCSGTSIDNDSQGETIIIKGASEIADTNNDKNNVRSWDNHASGILKSKVDQKLKEKIQPRESKDWSSRRRPQISKTENVALKYEEVADLKNDVLQLQLELLRAQKYSVQQDEKRKEEEHIRKLKLTEEESLLRKKALELDIAIKEEQLITLRNIT